MSKEQPDKRLLPVAINEINDRDPDDQPSSAHTTDEKQNAKPAVNTGNLFALARTNSQDQK